MTQSGHKQGQMTFFITGPGDIKIISHLFPGYNFKKPLNKKDYDLLKKVVAQKLCQQFSHSIKKYVEENQITVGCVVEEIRTGRLATVSSITKGGRLAFKGNRSGSHSPIHWKLHQPAGGKNEEEKE